MADMVEKVAKEIWDTAAWTATEDRQQYPPWAELDEQDANRLLCMAQARAAIRALMEPTEGMLKATIYEYDHAKALRDGEAPFAVDVWQAMLKAALDE